MKPLLVPSVILGLGMSTLTIAGQAEYDDCILKHLKGAKVDMATQLVKQACKENYKNPSFTSDEQRAYNNCLLEHLVEIESIQAVINIKASCKSKHK